MIKFNAMKKKWISKLEKLEMFLSVLKRQNLSIYGKRTIISNFANSKTLNDASINYKIKITIFIKVFKIMLNFIWIKE